jgi:protein gp37
MNPIGWCDRTLNPVVGCTHGCSWCYARRQAKRQKQRCSWCYKFITHPHLERLKQLTSNQKPQKIFIDSMWDWNDPCVDDEWLVQIIKKMIECKQHTFQILTQKPSGYWRHLYPKNVWLGVTVRDNCDLYRLELLLGNTINMNLKFVSVEPLFEKLNYWFSRVRWIIVGAETGNRKNKIVPEKDWVQSIIDNARIEHIPIYIKDNLKWNENIKEFPITDEKS